MATYTNLNPGTYLFRVKASNNDGVWNEKGASLKITILPPWWRTTWAYFIYTIIIGGIIFISIRIYTNRLKMQNQLNREQFERAQLEKLNQLKSSVLFQYHPRIQNAINAYYQPFGSHK